MSYSDSELIKNIPLGDRRALSRLISFIENRDDRAREVQKALYRLRKPVHVIGVTGSPGAGKSTLVDQLCRKYRSGGKEVAILAVDPSSPFSGGAVLGDRIRMNASLEDPGVYVRSLATRGSLGGLARATGEIIDLCAAANFDYVIVETVGVGQAEIDIVQAADTTVVVLVPGMGDGVQAIKAGILEIADVFAINKADRDGYNNLQKEIKTMLSLVPLPEGSWEPEIIKTIATEGTGVEELLSAIEKHLRWLNESKVGHDKRAQRVRQSILKLVHENLYGQICKNLEGSLGKQIDDCLNNLNDPYSVSQAIISERVDFKL